MWPRWSRLQAVRSLVVLGIATLAGLSLSHRQPSPMESLLASAVHSNVRPVEAWLVDFPYARISVTRSAEDSLDGSLQLRAMAARIVESKETHDEHLTGIGQLIAGNAEAATTLLEKAARSSNDARLWNDLAAARMELAKRQNAPEWLAASLAASIRALEIDPECLPAFFNRALVLDALHIDTAAAKAYADYLNRDDASPWADEVRQRLALLPTTTVAAEWNRARTKLEIVCVNGDGDAAASIVRQFAQEARTWGEGPYLTTWAEQANSDRLQAANALAIARCIGTALKNTSGERLLLDIVASIEQGDGATQARAQLVYRNGRLAYRDGNRRVAGDLFGQAELLFANARSPMAFVAGSYKAATLVDGGDSSDGLALLDALEARRNPSWLALHAQIETERALALGRTDRIYETIDAAQEGLRQFEALKETDNTMRSRANLMAALTVTGASGQAWKSRQKLFADASATGSPNVLPAVVLNAVNDALYEGKWEIAGALATELAKLDIQSPVIRAEATLWRDFARARNSSPATISTFGSAHAAAGAIPDADLRDELLDKIRLAEADLIAEQDPVRAIRSADAVIEYRQSRFPRLLPRALVVRARAFRALGDATSAANDLDRAMDTIESQRSTFRDDVARDTYVGGDDRMFDEALDLAASSADYARMFRIAEHSSTRLITDRLGGSGTVLHSPEETRGKVPADTVILHFTALRDFSVGIAMSAGGTRAIRIKAGRSMLKTLRDSFLSAIADDHPAANEHARRFYDLLFAPLSREIRSASAIVVVTDGALSPIPFEAFLDPATGRFVLEDHVVTRAPSVSAWIARHDVVAEPKKRRALLAGDPAFDTARYPSLPPLGAARNEVATSAREYAGSDVLVGEDVTRARLLASMPEAEVIHIAAHAMANVRDASLSVMLLTPAAHDAGLLSVHDVARLRLQRSPVVVLAGCQTAVEATAHRGSTTSFALAFLAAGARSVAGTLWNVDDAVARDFSVAFHHDVSRGMSPPIAARNAQLAVMKARGRDQFRAWAGFQSYGYE